MHVTDTELWSRNISVGVTGKGPLGDLGQALEHQAALSTVVTAQECWTCPCAVMGGGEEGEGSGADICLLQGPPLPTRCPSPPNLSPSFTPILTPSLCSPERLLNSERPGTLPTWKEAPSLPTELWPRAVALALEGIRVPRGLV